MFPLSQLFTFTHKITHGLSPLFPHILDNSDSAVRSVWCIDIIIIIIIITKY